MNDFGSPEKLRVIEWLTGLPGGERPSSLNLPKGHWVICVGYQKKIDGNVFYFNDPACVGYGLMREADFNRRWIDMDAAGTIYDHYGIEIDESGSAYDPQGVFELE